jgi:HK97 family phage major capsid protein
VNKLNELLAELGTALSRTQQGANTPQITRALGKLAAFAADGGDGEAAGSRRDDLAQQVLQLQADMKSLARQSAQMTVIRRMSSPVRDGQVLRDGRAMMGFQHDADAKDFADFCLRIRHGETKDLSPAGGEEGGYLVPSPQVDMEIRRMVMEVGLAARIGREQPLAAGGNLALRRLAGPTAYWKAAGAAGTPSTPTIGGLRLTPETLLALVDVDFELFQDSTVNLGNYLATEFAYALGYKEDEAAFVGDGSPTYAGITGILNSDRVTEVTIASGATVAIFHFIDLANMEAELADMAFDNAAWLMHATTRAAIKGMTRDLDNQLPLWQRPSEKEPPEIMGYRHHVSGFFPRRMAVGADTRFLAFGDFSRGLLYGVRSRLAIDYSDAAGWVKLQRCFRCYERIDIAVDGFTSDERTAHPELRNPIVVLKTGPET